MNIKRTTLDAFWLREPGTVKVNLMMVKMWGKVAWYELVLETWLPHMGYYPLVSRRQVGPGVPQEHLVSPFFCNKSFHFYRNTKIFLQNMIQSRLLRICRIEEVID